MTLFNLEAMAECDFELSGWESDMQSRDFMYGNQTMLGRAIFQYV